MCECGHRMFTRFILLAVDCYLVLKGILVRFVSCRKIQLNMSTNVMASKLVNILFQNFSLYIESYYISDGHYISTQINKES